jgi:MFS family permease
VLGRLPMGAGTLALLLLVQDATGSFATAGLVEGFFAAGLAVGLPMLGRIVDRDGHTHVLLAAAVVEAAALTSLVIVADSGASIPGMCAVALVAGAATPPLGLCMRGIWSAALGEDDDRLQSAFAIEAVIVEIVFICGPLLAAALAAGISPSAGVLTFAGLSLVGTLTFAASEASRSWQPMARAERHWAGALRAPGLLVIGAAAAGFGLGQGILEVTLTAFGGDHGSTAIAGPLISMQAGASMIGGLWYGARRWRSDPADRFALLNVLLAVGFAPLVLAGSVGGLAVLMILPGLALAPVTSTCYLLISRVAPPGTATEGFGWSITATVVGAGIGSALGGSIVNGGHVSAGFLAAFAGVALGATAALVGRRTLATPASDASSLATPV